MTSYRYQSNRTFKEAGNFTDMILAPTGALGEGMSCIDQPLISADHPLSNGA